MGCPIGQNSFFGTSNKYIKFLSGDLVATDGPNLVEKQILNDLRIPYEQTLRGRVVLKAGQVNYLMKHLLAVGNLEKKKMERVKQAEVA